MNKINLKKEIINVLLTIFVSIFFAVGVYVFVYANSFSPSGIDGIATMIQEKTGYNAGVVTLIINFPLFIIAIFALNKKYVIYTILTIVIASISIMVLEKINFYQYTENKIMAALFSGIFMGVRTGSMMKLSASSGGIDIIACLIQKKKPHLNIERIISIICFIIIGSSYFIYRDINCIMLSIIQLFVFEGTVSYLMKDNRHAIEVKIITKNPQEIKNELLYNFKHGGTIVESKGLYTNEDSFIIHSVINRRQLSELFILTKKYPNTFIYYNEVQGVRGNFRWFKDDAVK